MPGVALPSTLRVRRATMPSADVAPLEGGSMRPELMNSPSVSGVPSLKSATLAPLCSGHSPDVVWPVMDMTPLS